MDREKIFKKSHMKESSAFSREYFLQLGITFKDISLNEIEVLQKFIQREIDFLLLDKSYHMIKNLCINKKISFSENGIYLFTAGEYFKKREAVSFEPNGFIGICGWASGCNRIPYIKGFVKWCDFMGME